MNTARSRPLVRTVPFFLIGCWFGCQFKCGLIVLLISTSLLAFLTLHPRGWLPYPYRWVAGVCMCTAMFSVGALLKFINDPRVSAFHCSHHSGRFCSVAITEKPVRKGSYLRTYAAVEAFVDRGICRPASGKILLYLKPRAYPNGLQEGDRLLIRNRLVPAEPPADPGQFDFSDWLANKGIYHTARIDSGEWRSVGARPGYKLTAWFTQLRESLNSQFRHAGLSGNELGVVSAMVLGDDDEVDGRLMAAFSASGTLHVLSVSGMHAALVYGAVAWLLSRSFPGRKYERMRSILGILLLWSYALLTGFSPAVRRAAAMLTLVVTAKVINRQADTWNLLMGSLLMLVAADPGLVHESGFQLSYLAVAGIVGFYPWMYSTAIFQDRARDLIWQSVCVAAAAQLFTFPLGLYYFHQFPNYFLPANLIILPLSTIVMFGGIILLLIHPFGFLFKFLSVPVSYSVCLLNQTVFLFEKLPYSQEKGIVLTGLECALLLLTVLIGVLFLVRKKTHFLFLAGFCFSCYLTFRIATGVKYSDQWSVVRWSGAHKKAVSIVSGRSAVTFIKKKDEFTDCMLQRVVAPGLDAMGVDRSRRLIVPADRSLGLKEVGLPFMYSNNTLILPDTTITVFPVSNAGRSQSTVVVRTLRQ